MDDDDAHSAHARAVAPILPARRGGRRRAGGGRRRCDSGAEAAGRRFCRRRLRVPRADARARPVPGHAGRRERVRRPRPGRELRAVCREPRRAGKDRHVVFCPTRGRAAPGKLLDFRGFAEESAADAATLFCYVVDPAEADAYRDVVGFGDDPRTTPLLFALPEAGRRVGFARFCVLEFCRGAVLLSRAPGVAHRAPCCVPRCWMVDDNVRSVKQWGPSGLQADDVAASFLDVLRTVGRLKVARDYAAVGIASSGKGTVSRGERFAVDAKATSIFKFCRFELAQCAGLSFEPRLRWAEDIAFSQAALASGKKLLKVNSCVFWQGRLRDGGCGAERALAARPGGAPLLEDGEHAKSATIRLLEAWIAAAAARASREKLRVADVQQVASSRTTTTATP